MRATGGFHAIMLLVCTHGGMGSLWGLAVNDMGSLKPLNDEEDVPWTMQVNEECRRMKSALFWLQCDTEEASKSRCRHNNGACFVCRSPNLTLCLGELSSSGFGSERTIKYFVSWGPSIIGKLPCEVTCWAKRSEIDHYLWVSMRESTHMLTYATSLKTKTS